MAQDALDRSVRVNNVSARIVGVAPPGFFGLRAGQWPDLYAPLAMKVAFQPNQNSAAPRGEDDGNWWVRQVGRLKPGVSETAARTQIGGLFRNMVVPDGTSKIPELVTLPGRRGFDGAEPPGCQGAVDSDAAGWSAAADRLRQRGESAVVALGRQAARVGRASGARSGANAAVPAASDRERSAGAPRRRCRTGVGLRAGAVHPSAVSDGPRCEQCVRSPRRPARSGIHRRALDPDRVPLRARTGRAGRARGISATRSKRRRDR